MEQNTAFKKQLYSIREFNANIFQHLKRNFVSPRGYVISSMYFMTGFHAKRIFQQEMEITLQNTAFKTQKEKKSFFLMSGFNAKAFFQREMMKIWENPFF